MDLKKLNKCIDDSRIPIAAIAEELGLSRQSLYLKLSGERDFKSSEVTKLSKMLRLTDEEKLSIFFAA